MEALAHHGPGARSREDGVQPPASVFARVLVGIDGSAESVEAARQAARLLDSGGGLTLLAAYDRPPTLVGGVNVGVPMYLDDDVQREAATKTLTAAREKLPADLAVQIRAVRGSSWDELIRQVERNHDTLLAVGAHGRNRALGILLGSTATEVVHKAPCSVLVTRAAATTFPRSVVVGVDGSRPSLQAAEVAIELAARHGASLRVLAAMGGKPIDTDGLPGLRHRLETSASRLEWSDQRPVEALLAATADADLLVVGSRGLHGFASLGSVSERLAHRAPCSVLVIREPMQDEEPEAAVTDVDADAVR